jgi:zinc D-Ala-D-Ala carboxypeptidase
MKPLRKMPRFRLVRTSLVIVIIIFAVLSALLGRGIQALVRSANHGNSEILQRESATASICQNPPKSILREPELISLDYGVVSKGGSVSAVQYVSYIFEAKEGEVFNYKTRDNICILVYDPNKQILSNQESLKQGQHIILISTPSGSTTFNVDMNLKNSNIFQANVSTPPNVSNLNRVKKFSDTFLGHYSYNEANQSQLILISSYAEDPYQRFEYFDREAGKALMRLIYAARDEGVWIVPVSGFRDLERQKLLFEKQIEKKGSEASAAKVSAPPGYSEHHTGYAIDLTDGQFPQQDITNEFAKTKAYHWLTLHAREFGFEMSFPQNNPEGVMFEPWHWRFIGNPDAMTTFTNARSVS